MLTSFCKMLDAMGDVDKGVETVLTSEAFARLRDMVEEVWGNNAAKFFEDGWTQREDGSLVVSYEGDFGCQFTAFLNGELTE
jgi:hypothetical protein